MRYLLTVMLLLLACGGFFGKSLPAPTGQEESGGAADSAGDSDTWTDTATDTDTDTTADTDTDTAPDTHTDVDPFIGDYPDQRVGIFYLTWHAYAYDAVLRSAGYTVEDVIRSGSLDFSDLVYDAGLYGEASAFHWHEEPALGYYSLYRPRDGEGAYAEPDAVTQHPDIRGIARAHAETLWGAGIDFVYVDLTNLPSWSPFGDVLGLRPLEVLIEEWGAMRAEGLPTPQIAAWVPVTDVGGAEPMFRRVLDAYDAAAPDLIYTHAGQPVLFITASASIDPGYAGEVAARGVLGVPLWGNLGADTLATGTAGWMQPCTSGGSFTTLVTPDTPCNQGYTTTSPLGTVLSVSRSFQLGYASLPLQAAGRLGGLTFQKQMETAFGVQPDVLIVNAWNEHIAQPQANPYDAGYGELRRSMGVTDATDATADWLWVDMYGSDLGRDFEPTVEDGGAGLTLLTSCLRVYRTGASACIDTSELCCQLAEGRTLIRSVRVSGSISGGDHVPTPDAAEVAGLVATGAWEEVCNPHYGPPGLCGGGTTPDGPFHLYPSGGAGRAPLYRCYSGADHFLSTDGACEGRTTERLLGYAATAPSSDMPRALTRCYGTVHLHALDAPCPGGSTAEAVLGYVR